MRGSRTKDEDKKKVIETKINNPDITLREIEEKTWINIETSRKIINQDLPAVVKSSENIANLIDSNNNLIALADKRLRELLENWEERITARDLVSVRESWFKQNLLLTPNADWSEKEFIVKFEL